MYFSKFGPRRRSRAKAAGIGKTSHQGGPRPLRIEPLESRTLLAATAVFDHIIYHPLKVGGSGVTPATSPYPATALIPAQIQTAYGISAISLDGVAGTGSRPDHRHRRRLRRSQYRQRRGGVQHPVRLAAIQRLRRPDAHRAEPDRRRTSLPGTDLGHVGTGRSRNRSTSSGRTRSPPGQHHPLRGQQRNRFRPDDRGPDGRGLFRRLRGFDELGRQRILRRDRLRLVLHDAQRHTGVTFVASTGDSGAPGEYPAYSPNVVAVGGTTLTSTPTTPTTAKPPGAAAAAGKAATRPSRVTKKSVQTSGMRQIPDVSFDADPNTGVAVYDSYDYELGSPWVAGRRHQRRRPCWAGLIAIADQLRVAQGLGTLDGLLADPARAVRDRRGRFPRHHQRQQRRLLGRARLRHGHRPGQPGRQQARARSGPVPAGTVTNPATTVSLAASTDATQYSQPITFAATVDKIDPGVAPPTGTVTFMDGSTAIGTRTLSARHGLFTDSSLAVGSHTITAVYGGDATFTGSTSAALAEVVTPLATITSLSDSARSITYGQAGDPHGHGQPPVRSAATPTGGTVTFTDQATSATLGTATLTAGTAAITINSLTAGMHGIIATYHGDGLYFQGSSASLPWGPSPRSPATDWRAMAATADRPPLRSSIIPLASRWTPPATCSSPTRSTTASARSTRARTSLPPSPATELRATAATADWPPLPSWTTPVGVAVDAGGDLFIADNGNNCIREVNGGTHVITTVAGNGTAGYSGDGGPATAAELDGPSASRWTPAATCSSPTPATTASARSTRARTSSPPSPATGPRAIAATADRPPPPNCIGPWASRWTPAATCSSPTPATTYPRGQRDHARHHHRRRQRDRGL